MRNTAKWAVLCLTAACLAISGAGCKQPGPDSVATKESGNQGQKQEDQKQEDQKQEETLEHTGKEVQGIEAVYPEMAPYPDEMAYMDPKTGELDDDAYFQALDVWWDEKRTKRVQAMECTDTLKPFFITSIRQFLKQEASQGADGNSGQQENRIYSPVNVYMALSMLAETTDGESRQQILNLLGTDSLETLRQQAGQVWESSYCQDGAVTSVLANSLWLDETVPFRKETLDSLASHYFASSYWGKMGTDAMDQRLQKWINEQTGDLLKDQASGLRLREDVLMALASTIHFRARWGNEFWEERTEEGIFHSPQGDISYDFMHGTCETYFWGEDFGAVYKWLDGAGGMWLILPDEGKTPEDLLESDEMMELFLDEGDWKNQKNLIVNLAMPKFDVVSDLDLTKGLVQLGITDVFDMEKSDFTPLAENAEGLFVSQASHAARVTVDEEGCTAAAYTVMAVAGGAMPSEEEMDFVLDRPFVFAITGEGGLVLFAGVVNQP